MKVLDFGVGRRKSVPTPLISWMILFAVFDGSFVGFDIRAVGIAFSDDPDIDVGRRDALAAFDKPSCGGLPGGAGASVSATYGLNAPTVRNVYFFCAERALLTFGSTS